MKLKKITIGFFIILFLFTIIPTVFFIPSVCASNSFALALNTETFTGSISSGDDSIQHEFTISSDVELIDISLEMPTGADYDLSLWDETGQRTGGWTDADHSTKTQIDNSAYSGYNADPETISVEPPTTSGTWKVGCYAYSGSGTYTITVVITTPDEDTTPPTISITSPTDGVTLNSADVTIAWSGSDAGSGIDHYAISLDSGTMTNVGTSTSHEYTGLDDGEHSVMVMAYDGAGNSNSDGITFTIDTSGGPVIYTFTGSIAEKGETEKYEFNILSGTNLIEVYLEMPSGKDWDLSLWDETDQRTGGWITGDGSQKTEIPNSVYSGWLTDPETISVDPPTSTGTWKVAMFAYTGSGDYEIIVKVHGGSTVPDTTPPTISITSPSDGSTLTSSSVTVSWMGSDAESGINHYEVQLDSGSWSNVGTSTSHKFTGVANGDHDVNVRAYDNAGNSNTDTVSFTVDASSGDTEKIAAFFWASDAGAQWVIDEYIGVLEDEGYTKFFDFEDTNNFEADFQQIANYEDSDDIVFFYLFGHGNNNGQHSYTAFAPSNSIIYSNEFRDMCDTLDSSRVGLLIESCHSGDWADDMEGGGYLAISTSDETHNSYAVGSLPNEGIFSDAFFDAVAGGSRAVDAFWIGEDSVDGWQAQYPKLCDESLYDFFAN